MEDAFLNVTKMAELEGTACDLDECSNQAVNYIYQKFSEFDIIIPVCKECIDKLNNKEWVLWFCVECCRSKWIHISESNHKHLYENENRVVWIVACPHCHKNQKGE